MRAFFATKLFGAVCLVLIAIPFNEARAEQWQTISKSGSVPCFVFARLAIALRTDGNKATISIYAAHVEKAADRKAFQSAYGNSTRTAYDIGFSIADATVVSAFVNVGNTQYDLFASTDAALLRTYVEQMHFEKTFAEAGSLQLFVRDAKGKRYNGVLDGRELKTGLKQLQEQCNGK